MTATTDRPVPTNRPGTAEPAAPVGRWRRALRRSPWWIVAAVLVIGALLWIYPFVWMVSASLKSSLEIFSGGLSLIPEQVVWSNYARAWNDAGCSPARG
jgi:raffinose/stachyose/melibiose transport system permease protein